MPTIVQPVLGSEPFRPRSATYLADPYGQLRRWREQGPCVIDPETGIWFLLSYELVEAGLSNIVRGHHPGPDRHEHFPANPFAADGPGHTGPRRLIVPSFTNRSLQRYRGRTQQIVDDVFVGKHAGDDLRVVDELGFRLPYLLTCDLLGVPAVDDPSELRDWTWKSLELIDAFLPEDRLRADVEAAGQLAGHLHEVIEWKRGHLSDDMLSLVIRAGDEGEILRPEQVVSYIHTLYLAGMHTTVNQIPLALLNLLEQRDQWERLAGDRSLLENAVEELLRFGSTAQYMRRTTETDVELPGLRVPSGTDVVCWIASANRDEARWGPTADTLDVSRADARHHLAFGRGAHVCVGSWLARMELQIVIDTIVGRFPHTTLADQDLVWGSNVIHGPEELVLTLG